MKQALMNLDYKGVFPVEGEKEEEFYGRGKKFLDKAYYLQDMVSGNEVSTRKGLEDFEEKFLTRPDWIACFYNTEADRRKRGFPSLGSWTISENGESKIKIPYVSLDKRFYGLGYNDDSGQILREGFIRVIRSFQESGHSKSPVLGVSKDTGKGFAYSLGAEGKAKYFADHEHPVVYAFFSFLSAIPLAESFLYLLGSSYANIFRGAGLVGAVGAGIVGNYILSSIRNESTSKKVFEGIEKIKSETGSSIYENPELAYSLLRMTSGDIFGFENYVMRSGNYDYTDNFREYVHLNSVKNLRFRVMAERLG